MEFRVARINEMPSCSSSNIIEQRDINKQKSRVYGSLCRREICVKASVREVRRRPVVLNLLETQFPSWNPKPNDL